MSSGADQDSSVGPEPAGAEKAIALETPPAEAEPHVAQLERGVPSVNRRASLEHRVSRGLSMALMSVLGASALLWYYSGAVSRSNRLLSEAQASARTKGQGETALPSIGHVVAPNPQGAATPQAGHAAAGASYVIPNILGPAPAVPPGFQGTGGAAGPMDARVGATRQTSALDRRLNSPVYVAMDGSAQRAADAAVLEGRAMEGSTGFGGSGASNRGFAATLVTQTSPAVQARVLPTRRLLLPRGAFIDCTLETAIDSSLPGMTTCLTAADTFGADGTVVLLERGTKLVGETRGEVKAGSVRIFVVWTEARTPTGVVVALDSPGTDELGRSGLPGAVNRHFTERFGAAIVLSIIDGAVAAASRAGSGNSTVLYPSSDSHSVATEALKSTVNIPPTVTKAAGDRIQVLVARDLDFRSVYALHPSEE